MRNIIDFDEEMDMVEDTAEEVVSNSGKGFKIFVGVGVTILVGFLAYKYLIKPAIERVRAREMEELEELRCVEEPEPEFQEVETIVEPEPPKQKATRKKPEPKNEETK